ncbi:Uncharacterized protein DBV15_12047 [Temnothorax longispinosus]|uniref:Uncharacterized protein n=1 Tax=Temnothorax longispinosus TaxID=300112 RepID=A0A4S2K9I2_9HYME|nr:Uncharacterized protein DBV15_12047 [Temnothorax longispinosus]
MDLEEISYVTLFLLIWHQNIMLQLANNQRKTRRWWVRPVNRRKRQQGFLNNLFREIRSTDHEEFFTYTRLYPEQYRTLLELVTPYLTKCSIRKPLSPDTRLAITLTYLAQGDSVVTKHLEYRVGRSTVYKIIPKPEHLYVETDEGRSFEDRWHGIGVGEYFKQLSRVGPNRAGALSLGLRNYLKEYFVSPTGNAQAPWQFDRAFKESYINLIA